MALGQPEPWGETSLSRHHHRRRRCSPPSAQRPRAPGRPREKPINKLDKRRCGNTDRSSSRGLPWCAGLPARPHAYCAANPEPCWGTRCRASPLAYRRSLSRVGARVTPCAKQRPPYRVLRVCVQVSSGTRASCKPEPHSRPEWPYYPYFSYSTRSMHASRTRLHHSRQARAQELPDSK